MEPITLVVLIHGLLGSPEDLRYMKNELLKSSFRTAHIYAAKCNSKIRGTLDGLDNASARLRIELLDVLSDYTQIKRISFIGVNYGGIIARHFIGKNYNETANTVLGLEPDNFITFATPHIGVSSLDTWWTKFQLRWSPEFALVHDVLDLCDTTLKNMSDPNSVYMLALSAFKKRVLYGNVVGDFLVSYQSSTLYPDANYDREHLLAHFDEGEISPQEPVLNDAELEMIKNLRTLKWDRIDCYFNGWFPWALNPGNIIVANPWFNSIGKDVIENLIESYEF